MPCSVLQKLPQASTNKQERVTSKSSRKKTGGADFNIETNPRNPRHRIKLAINNWLADLSKAIIAPPQPGKLHSDGASSASAVAGGSAGAPWSLLLETHNLNTLSALVERGTGVRPDTTVIPNPGPDECEAIRASATHAGVNVFELSSHQLIEALAERSPDSAIRAGLANAGWPGTFAVVWLDYCGTFASSAGRQRQMDIVRLFQHGMLQERGAMLAVTLSQRGAAPLYQHDVVDSLVAFVRAVALSCGRSLAVVGATAYCISSLQFTVAFKVGAAEAFKEACVARGGGAVAKGRKGSSALAGSPAGGAGLSAAEAGAAGPAGCEAAGATDATDATDAVTLDCSDLGGTRVQWYRRWDAPALLRSAYFRAITGAGGAGASERVGPGARAGGGAAGG